MRAKKLVGVITSTTLTFSMVFGGVVPVNAEEPGAPETAIETTVVETPAAEPAAETPAEVPAAEPVVEEPAPVVEEPAVVEPIVEEQAPEEPADEEPEVVEETNEEENEEPFEEEETLEDGGMLTLELTPLSDDEGLVGISAMSLESSLMAVESKEAATQITLDGDLSDWDTHEATEVNDGKIESLDMVWAEDGGLYLKIKDADGLWQSGATFVSNHNDGQWVITSDTGRMVVFRIKSEWVNGVQTYYLTDADGDRIEGAELFYTAGKTPDAESNWQPYGGTYEIKLPASLLKSYNSSVSIGYYDSADTNYLISDVANPYITPSEAGTVSDIEFDGNYGDWDHVVGQQLVQYSTNKADAEAKLLTSESGDLLNVFVQAYKEGQYQDCFNFFELAINGDYNNGIGFQLLYLGDDGYLHPIEGLNDGTPGTYTYYIGGVHEGIWNYGEVSITPDSTDANHPILGQMYFTVDATGKVTTESQIDLTQIAYWLGVEEDNMQKVEMRWIRIGDKWIAAAGTSTGPIPGILMGIGVAGFAAWGYKKKETGVATEA